MNVLHKLNIALLLSLGACPALLHTTYSDCGYTAKVRKKAGHAAHTCKRSVSNLWHNRSPQEIEHIKSNLKALVAHMREFLERITYADLQRMNEWYDQCYENLFPDTIESDRKLQENMEFIVSHFNSVIDEAQDHLDEMSARSQLPDKSLGEKTAEVIDYSVEKVKSGYETVKETIHDATTPTTGQKIGEKVDDAKDYVEHKADVIKKEAQIAEKGAEIVVAKTKHNTTQAAKDAARSARDKISEATK